MSQHCEATVNPALLSNSRKADGFGSTQIALKTTLNMLPFPLPLIDIVSDYMSSVLFCVTVTPNIDNIIKIVLNIIDETGTISPAITFDDEGDSWTQSHYLKGVLFDSTTDIMILFGNSYMFCWEDDFDDESLFTYIHMCLPNVTNPKHLLMYECRDALPINAPCVFRNRLYVVDQTQVKCCDLKLEPCCDTICSREQCATIVVVDDDALYLVGGDSRHGHEDVHNVCTIERFDGEKCEMYGEYSWCNGTRCTEIGGGTPAVVLCDESLLIVESIVYKTLENQAFRRSVVLFNLRTRTAEYVGNLNNLYRDVRLFNLDGRIVCIGCDKLDAFSEWWDLVDAFNPNTARVSGDGFTMEVFDQRTKTWTVTCESTEHLKLGTCFVF